MNTIVSIKDLRPQLETLFDNLDITAETKRDYQYRIKPFVRFVKKQGLHVNTYLDYKKSLALHNNLSVATKNKLLVVAKIMLRELSRLGHIPDITANVKLFSEVRKHKKEGITQEEIVTLSEHLKLLPENKESTRIKAIFSLLTYQGLRICEITRLHVSDIDFVTCTALIKGKGQDDKEQIYLNPKTIEAVRTHVRLNQISDGWLFPSNSNNNVGNALSTRGIQLLVTRTLIHLQISKSCHAFRHFFVTELIKVYKSDLSRVMSYSRHKSLSMLVIYNDAINQKQDLPRFFRTFKTIDF